MSTVPCSGKGLSKGWRPGIPQQEPVLAPVPSQIWSPCGHQHSPCLGFQGLQHVLEGSHVLGRESRGVSLVCQALPLLPVLFEVGVRVGSGGRRSQQGAGLKGEGPRAREAELVELEGRGREF